MGLRGLLLALIPLAGCVTECAMVYAPDAVTVGLAAGDWPAGTYEVALVGDDGSTVTCTATLPGGDDAACDPLGSVIVVADDGASLVEIDAMEFAPDSIDVTVTVDGALVHQETLAPSYQEDEPNGAGCGVRRSADVDVTW